MNCNQEINYYLLCERKSKYHMEEERLVVLRFSKKTLYNLLLLHATFINVMNNRKPELTYYGTNPLSKNPKYSYHFLMRVFTYSFPGPVLLLSKGRRVLTYQVKSILG